MTDCALCSYLQAQNERLQRENLDLRLQVANSEATTSARRDLEVVNQRLAEANTRIAQLQRKKAS